MSSQGPTPAARTVMSVSPSPAGRGSGSDSSPTSSPNRSIPAAFTRPPACRPDYPSLDTPSPPPASPGRRRPPSHELELGLAGKPLDAGPLAERRGSVRHRKDRRQLDRQAAPRVAAGGARPVGGQAPLDVGGPAAVEAVVGATQQVDVGHPRGVRGQPWPACHDGRMAYTTAEGRQELLDTFAQAAGELALASACLSEAYEQLDEDSGDRLEEQCFRPVQTSYGRAKRAHSEFAGRHGLQATGRFEQQVAGLPSQGAAAFIAHAVEAVG